MYLGLPASTGEPPKRLVGYAKSTLTAGQTTHRDLTIDPARQPTRSATSTPHQPLENRPRHLHGLRRIVRTDNPADGDVHDRLMDAAAQGSRLKLAQPDAGVAR